MFGSFLLLEIITDRIVATNLWGTIFSPQPKSDEHDPNIDLREQWHPLVNEIFNLKEKIVIVWLCFFDIFEFNQH